MWPSAMFSRRLLAARSPSSILRYQLPVASLYRRSFKPSYPFLRPNSNPAAVRNNSSLAAPGSDGSSAPPDSSPPAYKLTFTCKPCGHRSSHRVTKQGYHHGTVLISCPHCKNRHIISDHLKIFMDQKSTLEDILQRRAGPDGDLTKLLKKGKLGIRQGTLVGNEGEEDVEFWEDGTESLHQSLDK